MVIINENTKRINEEIPQDFIKAIDNNPVSKKIKSIASKYGYRAEDSYLRRSGRPYIEIYVNSDFRPKVRYESNRFADKKGWKINTTSYGYLEVAEYTKLVDGYNKALKMIQELSKLDLSQLEQEPDKF